VPNIWRRQPSGRLSSDNFIPNSGTDASVAIANAFFEAAGVTYYGILKRWTGTAWINAKLKTYIGSLFVAKPLRRWDGTSWKLVDTSG
jgi:hypothetical protein